MNILTYVRISLLIGPLYLWITFFTKIRTGDEFIQSHNYEKLDVNNPYCLHTFIAISCISIAITAYIDHKINVRYKHHMNIALIIIPYIIYACKITNLWRLSLNLSMLVLSPFIIGHILLYYIILTIVKEKYERYNRGLPLFTPEEKQSYMEIFIKHYCKKEEKCCSCDCKCKSKCK